MLYRCRLTGNLMYARETVTHTVHSMYHFYTKDKWTKPGNLQTNTQTNKKRSDGYRTAMDNFFMLSIFKELNQG